LAVSFLCVTNSTGAPAYFVTSTEIFEFGFIGAALSYEEFGTLKTIINNYIGNL
jgi:hypothetical protein